MPTPIKSYEEIKEEFRTWAYDNLSTGTADDDRIEEFLLSKMKEREEELEKERYWSPCSGCKDGHPSFWKTVVESKEWKAWEKEQNRRFRSETKEGCFDIDECRECGWISPAHFQEFLEFCWKEREAGLVEREQKVRENEMMFIKDLQHRCPQCGVEIKTPMTWWESYKINALWGRCFDCVSKDNSLTSTKEK